MTVHHGADEPAVEAAALCRSHPLRFVEFLRDAFGGVAGSTKRVDLRDEVLVLLQLRQLADGPTQARRRLVAAGPVDDHVDPFGVGIHGDRHLVDHKS